MLTLLTRLLLFISALWLVRHILAVLFRGAQPRGRAGTPADGTPTQKMVKDPTCGMYMDPRLAFKVENKQGTFFFCSEECRKKFLSGNRA